MKYKSKARRVLVKSFSPTGLLIVIKLDTSTGSRLFTKGSSPIF